MPELEFTHSSLPTLSLTESALDRLAPPQQLFDCVPQFNHRFALPLEWLPIF